MNCSPHPSSVASTARHVNVTINAGHDFAGLRSKSWLDFAAPDVPELDFVFTVWRRCRRRNCPVGPGVPIAAHWGVPDPAAAAVPDAEIAVAFNEAFGMLKHRIERLPALPIAKLDRLALTAPLREIGRVEDATASAKVFSL